jgi:hypothetical protein
MFPTTRRQFLHSSLFAGTGLVLGSASAAAIEPIRRLGPAHLRLSLAAYSFRQALDLQRKPKPAMTLDDFIDRAARLNLDAVELADYNFPQTTPGWVRRPCASSAGGRALLPAFVTILGSVPPR